ncbi:MAG: GrpB family protein [Acidimicrobiia bacterium]
MRDAHVHVCLAGGTWEADHLLFRDFLLAHDDVRDRYGELKMDLAQKFAADRIAYTEAKSDFIRETMARARTWRSAGDDGGG